MCVTSLIFSRRFSVASRFKGRFSSSRSRMHVTGGRVRLISNPFTTESRIVHAHTKTILPQLWRQAQAERNRWVFFFARRGAVRWFVVLCTKPIRTSLTNKCLTLATIPSALWHYSWSTRESKSLHQNLSCTSTIYVRLCWHIKYIGLHSVRALVCVCVFRFRRTSITIYLLHPANIICTSLQLFRTPWLLWNLYLFFFFG